MRRMNRFLSLHPIYLKCSCQLDEPQAQVGTPSGILFVVPLFCSLCASSSLPFSYLLTPWPCQDILWRCSSSLWCLGARWHVSCHLFTLCRRDVISLRRTIAIGYLGCEQASRRHKWGGFGTGRRCRVWNHYSFVAASRASLCVSYRLSSITWDGLRCDVGLYSWEFVSIVDWCPAAARKIYRPDTATSPPAVLHRSNVLWEKLPRTVNGVPKGGGMCTYVC